MKDSVFSVRTLTVSAMLVAVGVVLSFLRIPLSTITEVTLTGLPIALAHLVKTILISLLLNCFWLSVFYGMPFKAVFVGSIPKEAINSPIEVFLIFSILRILRTYLKNHEV